MKKWNKKWANENEQNRLKYELMSYPRRKQGKRWGIVSKVRKKSKKTNKGC